MEIIINGKLDPDPRSRILALEAVTQSICERFGMDPAEGTMMLLTAAVHIAMKHSDRPLRQIDLTLASSLGAAIVAAEGFFTLRPLSAGKSEVQS
jgi:hypothetical protein